MPPRTPIGMGAVSLRLELAILILFSAMWILFLDRAATTVHKFQLGWRDLCGINGTPEPVM